VQRPLVAKRVRKTVRVHGKRVTKTITVWSRSGLPEPAVLDVDTPLDGVLQATIQTAPAGSSLSVLRSTRRRGRDLNPRSA
jgi:hypothetical protein